MTVIGLLFVLVVMAVAAYFVNTKLPIGQGWKTLINVVLIVIAVILCLVAFGLWDQVRDVKVPRV